TQQGIAVQQLPQHNRLAAADGAAVHTRQLVERIRHQRVPQQRVERSSGVVELRPVQLLPQCRRRIALLPALSYVVRLVVRVADLEQPALELMLQVQAVLPRVKPVRIRIVEINTGSQVGERSQRGSSGAENSSAEWICQRIEGSEEIVLRGDQRCRAAESILPAAVEAGLRESSDTAAYHRVWTQPVRETCARLPLVIIAVRVPGRLAVDTGEQDRTWHPERIRGQNLFQRLHAGIAGVTGTS